MVPSSPELAIVRVDFFCQPLAPDSNAFRFDVTANESPSEPVTADCRRKAASAGVDEHCRSKRKSIQVAVFAP
jgi:hypothetical protein